MKRRNEIKRSAKDLEDAAHEYAHRIKADTERVKRKVAGGEMTTTQKVTSAVKEAGHRTAADVDKTKRAVRDKSW